MRALIVLALAALPNGPTDVRVEIAPPDACGPAPEMPAVMQHYLEEIKNEDGSVTYINTETAWLAVAAPNCWVLGRALVGVYHAPEGPQVMEPTDVGDIKYD